MIPIVTVATAPKAGGREGENDDRARWVLDDDVLRVAVADGATESAFSDLWAEAIVATWTARRRTGIADRRTLAAARQSWLRDIPPRETLPWHGQLKLDEGSAAAAALVMLRRAGSLWRWRAAIIGDCEVFILRSGRSLTLHRAAPFQESSEFGYRPILLSTLPALWPRTPPRRFRGIVHAPFELWVATDAFAQSCLASLERRDAPWDRWTDAIREPDLFQRSVDLARSRGEMRNDDVTLVRVEAF
jgi:hypothetical protein